VEHVLQFPAAQLFVERAAAVRSGFRLRDREDALAVARICRRLDGIPLALELAAARVTVLPVAQIAARLDDRFQLLTGGSRAALRRHQTLRALIDWSYDGLPEAEAVLLRRLSVFAGGWTLEAAEAVCSDFGFWIAGNVKGSGRSDAFVGPNPKSKIQNTEVLDLLGSLVDRSLVLLEEATLGLRYRMLETVREYAREKLREHGEEAAARGQHLAYLLHLAEEAGPSLSGTDPEATLALVEGEIDNFRAALAWAHTPAAPADASLRLTASLWPFWEMRGYHAEGREHLRAALNQPDLPESPERAQVLLGAATLAFVQVELEVADALGRESLERFRALVHPRGSAAALLLLGHVSLERGDVATARGLLSEGLDHCRQSGWERGTALTLVHLGMVARQEGDPLLARSLLDQSRSMAERVGDAPTVALSLHHLGWLAVETGDDARAGPLLEKSLEIRRRLGYRHATSMTLRCLGDIARRQGDLARALSCYEEAAAMCREQGNRTHLAMVLQQVGNVLYEQGSYETARPAYAESLDLFRQAGRSGGIDFACNTLGSTLIHLGDPAGAKALHREALAIYYSQESAEGVTWSLERLGMVEALHGDAPTAVRMLGAASTARKGLGIPLARWDQADWDQAIASLRAGLGATAFDAAWAEGRAMTLDEAVEIASEGDQPSVLSPGRPSRL
jgi:non-specific serine/threonine protein kinase